MQTERFIQPRRRLRLREIEEAQARFDAGAAAWADYNQGPLGRIRRQVTWHNLAAHLPDVGDPERPPYVLDAGGGSGELALQLVRRGYRVWLLDYAPSMLDQARRTVQGLAPQVRARLTFCQMAVDDAPHAFPPHFFGAIACHTLIEYVSDPRSTLRDLAGLLRDGGLLSVSFVNRHAEVLRQVWSRIDPTSALASLEDGAFCATLFGLSGVAYTAEQVSNWLSSLGLTVTTMYGVRAFADYVPRHCLNDPHFFDALLRLEMTAAERPPYNLLARYIQLIAHKGAGHSRRTTD